MSQLTQLASPARYAPLVRTRTFWWQSAVLLALLAWLYSSILSHLVLQWWTDPNFSHGFFVPVFSLYVLFREHSRLVQVPQRPSAWGLLILVFALAVLIVGVLGAELFLARVSFLLLVAGLVVFFYGWGYFRRGFFPWAFLFLMIPIPTIIFDQITFPLQILASKVAASVLPLFGVPVLREGNIINLPAISLEVVQACSGIRSLLSLVTLAIIYGYTMEKSRSIRFLLAIAAVPIAIAANSLRIVGAGLLVQYWAPDKAEGFFHAFSGWIVFVISLAMLFLLHRILSWRNMRRSARGL